MTPAALVLAAAFLAPDQPTLTHPALHAQVVERVQEAADAALLASLKTPEHEVAVAAGRARLAAERAAEAARVEAQRQAAAAEAARAAERAAAWVLPLSDYRLTARFGQCGSHWARCHTGLDFAANSGEKVRAIHGGEVVSAGWADAYGWQLVIDHGSVVSSYSHLSRFDVRSGWVETGELIGRVGSTGNSTGPHTHLEISVDGSTVDPYAFLAERGVNP